jgi:hypothetical protein
MPTSLYDDRIVYNLRKRLWASAFKYGRELRASGNPRETVSALELLTALQIMTEETRHHWVDDNKKWNDILAEQPR